MIYYFPRYSSIYTFDFKEIAVDLGIIDKTLYSWISTFRKKHKLNTTKIENSTLKSSKESLEQKNRRLLKELAKVTQKREILKKATVSQGHFYQGTTSQNCELKYPWTRCKYHRNQFKISLICKILQVFENQLLLNNVGA
jgi:hypothetical protein